MFSRVKRNSFTPWNTLHANHSHDLRPIKYPILDPIIGSIQFFPGGKYNLCPSLIKFRIFWKFVLICTCKVKMMLLGSYTSLVFSNFWELQSSEALTIEWFCNMENKKVRISYCRKIWLWGFLLETKGFSGDSAATCNAGDLGSIPGLGRFPWRREWLFTPVFWPGESHGLHSLWGRKELDTIESLSLSLS